MTPNIYANLPQNLPEELTETLLTSPTVTIERIISQGHCSPPDDWYDQSQHEWVLLLQGKAELVFDDSTEPSHLIAGDYLHINAHRKHRVQSTSTDEPTIWLAIFYSALS